MEEESRRKRYRKVEEIIRTSINMKAAFAKEGIKGAEYTKFMRNFGEIFKKFGKESIRQRKKRYKYCTSSEQVGHL